MQKPRKLQPQHFILFFFALILWMSLSFCAGSNLVTLIHPEASTHPIPGDSNPLQQLSRPGWIYSHFREVGGEWGNAKFTHSGLSCSKSWIGLIALGDSSIRAAMQDAGLQKISFVEFDQFSLLGGVLYHSFCTRVWGEKSEAELKVDPKN
ncbi:hypothetical protein CH373_04335 [Leptospira perolatii]|uniref:TRL-like family protein n=1 Tax=Leptospira perolatii TaxID=2023191 RepID=A0A2M9ZQ04_9LEPT|nr:TRL-like family protein [Leptospira perolatii]PJZ68980.1 hypothetical protein CH360_12995 [Leptospira perolatii]PJZ74152.1 hypothetical protein CH373_04335 [Leptospira perolatii]